MPRRIFSFDEPERFVAVTVGEPGSRAFFLQARDGRRIVSVSLEKAQVAVLADWLAALLEGTGRHGLDLSGPRAAGAGKRCRPARQPLGRSSEPAPSA